MDGGLDCQERPDSYLLGHGGEALSSLLKCKMREDNVAKKTWVGSHISHVWANNFLCGIQHPYGAPGVKGYSRRGNLSEDLFCAPPEV